MWLTVTILVSRDGRGERGGKLFFKRRIFNLSPRWKILTDSRPWSIEICIFHGGLEHVETLVALVIVTFICEVEVSFLFFFLFFSKSSNSDKFLVTNFWDKTIYFLFIVSSGRSFQLFFFFFFFKKERKKKKAFICFRRIVKCNFNVALLQLVL